MIVTREGLHFGVEKQLVKRIPDAANASRFGVL
jgi:hypothetical protein